MGRSPSTAAHRLRHTISTPAGYGSRRGSQYAWLSSSGATVRPVSMRPTWTAQTAHARDDVGEERTDHEWAEGPGQPQCRHSRPGLPGREIRCRSRARTSPASLADVGCVRLPRLTCRYAVGGRWLSLARCGRPADCLRTARGPPDGRAQDGPPIRRAGREIATPDTGPRRTLEVRREQHDPTQPPIPPSPCRATPTRRAHRPQRRT
jgi:hypothetical protein